MTTHLRRKLALVACLVAVAAPLLSSCGLGGQDAATNRYNVLANAGYDLGNGMRVVGTRIVASADGEGVFIATITLNPSIDAATSTKAFAHQHAFTGLAAASGATVTVTPESSFSKVVTGTGAANLADPKIGGVPVTGTFKAGDIVPLTLTFADGSSATVETPVVTDCFEYSGAGTSTYTLPSAIPSPSQVASPGPYQCAYPSLPAVGE